jgi:hypothetical protein
MANKKPFKQVLRTCISADCALALVKNPKINNTRQKSEFSVLRIKLLLIASLKGALANPSIKRDA